MPLLLASVSPCLSLLLFLSLDSLFLLVPSFPVPGSIFHQSLYSSLSFGLYSAVWLGFRSIHSSLFSCPLLVSVFVIVFSRCWSSLKVSVCFHLAFFVFFPMSGRLFGRLLRRFPVVAPTIFPSSH